MVEIVRTVGRYELLDVLGRGGAGVVYRARQTDLDRLVAVKQLVDLSGGDAQLVARFLREARLAGTLTHPNIVPVYEYLEHDGSAYIAMELLPHGSLRGYMGSLDLARIGGVLEGILAALIYASGKFVHRDIKPENVLVGGDGRVKLGDFGIARAIGATTTQATLTTAGGIIGSPAYMAPEQATGGELGPWTDLYSTGVVAYELLVGERPFPRAGTPAAAVRQLVSDPIRPPIELRPSLDPGLAEWLERALRKTPTDRHSSAADAWETLEEHLVRLLGERWRRTSAIAVDPAPSLSMPPPRSSPAPATATARALDASADELPTRSRVARLAAIAVPLAALAALLAAIAAGR